MLGVFNRRLVFLGLLLILAAVIIACGEAATDTDAPATEAAVAPTAAPAGTPTPAATPTPSAAPEPAVAAGPSGHIKVGMAEVAAIQHVLHLQTYSALKYDTLLTHEPMFRRDKDDNLHGLLVKGVGRRPQRPDAYLQTTGGCVLAQHPLRRVGRVQCRRLPVQLGQREHRGLAPS